MPTDIMEALGKAAEGLLYPSETDAPLATVTLPGVELTAEAVEVATRSKGAKKARKTAEQSVSDFFAELDDADDAAGFRKLRKAVEKCLPGGRVFRIGGPKVEVYLLGAVEGGLAGLQTVSVET